MASHLKGVKMSTLTDEMRKTLCEYKNEHPSSSQKDLQYQSTISNTLKRSSEYLSKEIKNSNVKRHKSNKYPELVNVLYEWFLQYQEKVNMTGEMIQTKAKEFLHKMYGDANSEFNFSIGWLERFKERHGIKFYRRFDMSLEQEIGDIEGIHKLKAIISDLHYRNVMDVEQILNYPSENESLMELPTDEEIIQGVMDVPIDDEQDPDDNIVLPHVSPKEAFLIVDILKNYLTQHEKNIPDLVYALLKVEDEIVYDSHAKNKQLTIDA
ncbi:hypothetical protein ES288_D07G172100v1 [Gossypium darwinii]|uniref:HTH CENPB-type domain-containing protein n=1 Tax=Gossypium darwinii TaxID=34276 RepID=A0A5D2BYY4_GOSDA|nr:hypothetical protein ES288_D07G172100v1 [Gossypium darwinii]